MDEIRYTNMTRMADMGLTNEEAQIVVGFLAGCERMAAALDTVDKFREDFSRES